MNRALLIVGALALASASCHSAATTPSVAAQSSREAPERVAGEERHPFMITADAGEVFWTTSDAIRVLRRSREVETLVGTENPVGIAVDAEFVYWTSLGGSIQRIARAQPGVAEPMAGGVAGPYGIALDGSPDARRASGDPGPATRSRRIYWTVRDADAVVQRDFETGETTTAATAVGWPFGIAIGDGGIFLTATKDSAVFFIGPRAARATVARGSVPEAIALSREYVYWLESSPGALLRARPRRGGPIEDVARVPGGTLGLAADESAVYWTSPHEGAVFRAAPGEHPVRIAVGQCEPTGMALDAGYVYWTCPGAGSVWRARK